MDHQRREFTIFERKRVILLHNLCKSLRDISRITGISKSSVHVIINRFGERKTLKNKTRCGRPRVLSAQDERFILRLIKKDPKCSAPSLAAAFENQGKKVSVSTIRNICRNNGYHGRVARKKYWVNDTSRKKRLEFARNYQNHNTDFWKRVIFSDESKFNIFGSDGRRMVWRKKGTEMQPQNLIPTVKQGGGSVFVWGCMSAAGVGKLHFIDGVMDQYMYINILKNNLRASAEKMDLKNNYIFQQDNDPKHTALNTKLWLLYNTPKQLHTPPQSPDINPIENLWSHLEKQIRKRQISNRNDLKTALQEEWDKIPPKITSDLVHSMPKRLEAIISAKGYPTKY